MRLGWAQPWFHEKPAALLGRAGNACALYTCAWGESNLDRVEDGGGHLCRSQVVGLQVGIAMVPRVGESSHLFGMLGGRPGELLSRGAGLIGGVEVDEEVRSGQDLPHIWDIGMLLSDLTRKEPLLPKRVGERGFPRTTRADDRDLERGEGVAQGHTSRIMRGLPLTAAGGRTFDGPHPPGGA